MSKQTATTREEINESLDVMMGYLSEIRRQIRALERAVKSGNVALYRYAKGAIEGASVSWGAEVWRHRGTHRYRNLTNMHEPTLERWHQREVELDRIMASRWGQLGAV